MTIPGSHYVKATGRTCGPVKLVVCVASVGTRQENEEESGNHEYARSVLCTVATRTGTKWGGAESPFYLSAVEFWNWIDSHCSPKRNLYCIAPIASDFLTLTGFWEECDRGRYYFTERLPRKVRASYKRLKAKRQWHGRLVLRGNPDIVSCRSRSGAITFVSASNFTDSSIADIAEGLIHGCEDIPDSYGAIEWTASDPYYQCQYLTKYFRCLISEWIAEDNGVWKDTASQLAVSLWKRKYYTQRICRHEHPDAIQLETDALHGGRATCWYYGDVGSRLMLDDRSQPPPKASLYPTLATQAHRLDVRSMYPAILANQQFPIRLLSVLRDCDPDSIVGLGWHWGVIAGVKLKTEVAEFPKKLDNGVIYPVGEFDTVLAGPELKLASDMGAIKRVYHVARYELGRPFKAFAEHMLEQRGKYHDSGNKVMEAFVKRMANSFGGKFAQKSNRWVARPDMLPERRWGEWPEINLSKRTYKYFKAIAGLAFEMVPGRPGASLLAAVFAYLTSYGRIQMMNYRQAIGREHVLSQDTDGLWLTDCGYERAQKLFDVVNASFGELQYKDSHTFVRWLDAQHYYCDGLWTWAGYKDGFTPHSDGFADVKVTVNPIRYKCSEAPKTVTTVTRSMPLSFHPHCGGIGKDGWLIPHRLTPDFVRPTHGDSPPVG